MPARQLAADGGNGDDFLDGGDEFDTIQGGADTDTCVDFEKETGCEIFP